MAVSQTSKIVLNILGRLMSGQDLSTALDKLSKRASVSLTSGTGDGQANMIWHDRRTLAASATEDLDLAASLISAFGATLTFTKIKGIFVIASSANTNAVRVQRAAANGVPLFLAAEDGLDVLPGGFFAHVGPGAGVTVTAATGDLLTITNSSSGTPVTYDIVIIGVA